MGFLKEFFSKIIDLLNPLSNNFILKTVISLLNYINPFSDDFILKDIISFLGSIFSFLNPFSDNFILKNVLSFLLDIISFINPFSDNFFGYKIIDLFSELLQFLFVPDSSKFDDIQNTITSKFAFINTIKNTIEIMQSTSFDGSSSAKFEIELSASKYTQAQTFTVLDLSWYAPYKPYGDIVFTSVIYIFFVWRVFITLANTINSVGGSSHLNSDLNDIFLGERWVGRK